MVAVVGFIFKCAKSLFVKPATIRHDHNHDETQIENDREHCCVARLRLFTTPSRDGNAITLTEHSLPR
jgi:hypothetical protein